MTKRTISFLWVLALAVAWPAHAMDGGIESLRQTGKAFAAVAKQVAPSVVFLQVESRAESRSRTQTMPYGDEWPFGDDFFKRFFGDRFHGMPGAPAPGREAPRSQRRVVGQGSGFVFVPPGGAPEGKAYILTNNHVVEKADKILVKLSDGRELEAEVKGRDPRSDVAVIEVEATGLPALPVADSAALEVGEWVIAVGNPFGLSQTFTVGIVSAKGRTGLGINDYEDFIQTDAAINPGNSGGPLVNLDGEVVGMNTAIFSRSGGYMGVGFAIPIDLAKAIADQLIDQGEVTRGYLGIMIQQVTPDLAESFGIEQNQGILVAQVLDDSPAARAGLKQGDIILAHGDEPVADVGAFRNKIALTLPGIEEELTVLRDGERIKVAVTIGTLSDEEQVAQEGAHSADEIGLSVQTLTPELAEQFGAEPGEGVVVTEVQPGSVASMAGIEPGTVILQVNRKAVASAEEFAQVLGEGGGNRVLLLVRKDNMQRYLALNW